MARRKGRLKLCHRHQRYLRRKRSQLANAINEKNQQESNSPREDDDGDGGDPQQQELQGHPITDPDHPWDPSIVVKEEPSEMLQMSEPRHHHDLPRNNDDDDDDELDIKPDVDSIGVEEVNTTPSKSSSSSPRTKSKRKPPRKTSSSSGSKKKTPPPPKKRKQDGKKKKTKKKKDASKGQRPLKIPGVVYPDNWDSMSPEEQDAWKLERRRKMSRENAALRRAFRPDLIAKYKRRELTKEEKEERNKRHSFQQLVRRAAMTEEELKEEKTKIYMRKCAKLSTLTEEEIEEKKRKERIASIVKRVKMTPEEREERRRRAAEARKNMTAEEKGRQREIRKGYQQKYWDKMKAERPLEYRARMHDMMVKNREKMLEHLRKRTQNETPEEREKRLLKCRVNQAKRKARKRMEEEGVVASPEEIERRLEEVAEQVRNQPRAPSSSQYRPREGARKPHVRKKPVVTPEEAGIVIRVGVKGKRTKYPEIYSKLAEVGDTDKISRRDIPTMFPKTDENEKVRKEIGEVDGEEPRLPTLKEFKPVVAAKPQSFQPIPEPPPPAPAVPVQELGMNEDSCGSLPSYGGDDDCPMEFDTGGGDVEEDEDVSAPELEPQHSQQGQEEIGEPAQPPPRIGPSSVSNVPPHPVVSTSTTSTSAVLPSTPHVKTEGTLTPAQVSLPPQPPPTSATITTTVNVKQEVVDVKLPAEAACDEEDLSLPAICDICGKLLKTGYSLKRHKEQLHDLSSNETKCPQCGLECASSRSLWSHYSKTHMGQTSSETKVVVTHSKVPNPNYIPAPPTPTPRPSPSTKPPRVPQTRSTDGVSNTCWHCGKNFKQKCTMDDHIRRVHEGKGFYCDLCPSSRGDLQSSAKLWKHKVDKHGIPPEELPPPTDQWGLIPIVSCCYCGEALLRGYEAHVKKRHPEELDQWRRENSPRPKKIKNASLLRVQPDGSKRLVGKGGKSSSAVPNMPPKWTTANCPECSKVVRKSSLGRHLRAVHGIGLIDMFKCDECGREFKEKQKLVEHVKYQHQYAEIEDRLEVKGLVKFDRPLKVADCLVCNQTIKILSPDSLRAHFVVEHHLLLNQIQSSSTEPLFPCDHCPQKFPNRKERHVHVVEAHPEVEPPPPAQAPRTGRGSHNPNHGTRKKVKELANLKTVCLKCGTVVSLGTLGRHLRVKHGEKDPLFVCEFCNKSFRRRDYHVCHLEMVHKVPREKLIVAPSEQELEASKEVRYKHLKNKQHFKKRRPGTSPTRNSTKSSARTEEPPLSLRGRTRGGGANQSQSQIEKDKRLVIKVVRLTREEIDKFGVGVA